MSTATLVPSGTARLARFFDEDWPLPQLFGGLRSLEPQIRVEEVVEGNTLIVRAEAPGIDPDKDVEVSMADGRLHISVERKETKEQKDRGSFRSEFRYGSFQRTVALPRGTKTTDVKANYKDGILEVRVPIPAAEAATTKVPVARG